MKKRIDKAFILHFLSYVLVGGLATLVEWGFFYLFDPVLHINTYLSTALAFVLSTFANWAFGRLITFRHSGRQNLLRELGMIYASSVVGLLLNEAIMFALLHLVFQNADSGQKMLTKIIATGLVFFWNFLIRDLVIYKKQPHGSEVSHK